MKEMKTSVVKVVVLLFSIGVMTSCLEDGSVNDFVEQQEDDVEVIEAYLADNNLTAQKFNNIIYKVPLETSSGDAVDVEDIVEISISLWKISDGAVLFEDSSYIYMPGNGFYLPEVSGAIAGPNISVANMKEGEKADFFYTSNLMFGAGSGTYDGISIGQNEIISATIELIDIRTEEEQKAYEAEVLRQYALENEYITEDAVPNEGGFYRIIQEEGTGTATVQSPDSVNIDYKGYLLDGEVFDENEEISFKTSGTIEGFKKGLAGLKKESKALLLIPSHLAYGEIGVFNNDGTIGIPPFEPLVFEVRVNGF